jgi:hypothetical protein
LIRFHFAKKAETLHAAGERLLKLAKTSEAAPSGLMARF